MERLYLSVSHMKILIYMISIIRLKTHKKFFARWVSNFDQDKKTEFWYVICDRKWIQDYSRNTRSKIRRGLKQCKVKKVEKKEIINKGFYSYVSFNNYNTHLLPKV